MPLYRIKIQLNTIVLADNKKEALKMFHNLDSRIELIDKATNVKKITSEYDKERYNN